MTVVGQLASQPHQLRYYAEYSVFNTVCAANSKPPTHTFRSSDSMNNTCSKINFQVLQSRCLFVHLSFLLLYKPAQATERTPARFRFLDKQITINKCAESCSVRQTVRSKSVHQLSFEARSGSDSFNTSKAVIPFSVLQLDEKESHKSLTAL